MKFLSTFDRRCYWLLLIFTINVPGFILFDPTGKSHDLGLFHPRSISHIALRFLVFAGEFQPVGVCALICLISLALVQRYGVPPSPRHQIADTGEALRIRAD